MITKKQLGIGLSVIGALILVGTFLIDLIGAGNFSGIGPYQQLALLGAGLMILVGLSLIPLGDRPA
jgi:hypothetical protein